MEGLSVFRDLVSKLYASFTLVGFTRSFLRNLRSCDRSAFWVKLFAFKLGLLQALGVAGSAAGTFLAGYIKPRTGLHVYLLYTTAFAMDVVVAIFPVYPVILSFLTVAGVIFYLANVHDQAYQFVSVPKETYVRVSSFSGLLRTLCSIVGALLTTYLAEVYSAGKVGCYSARHSCERNFTRVKVDKRIETARDVECNAFTLEERVDGCVALKQYR
jgi:hypothetical protein